MKIRKNLEAVFLVAAVLANFTSYAVAEVRVAKAIKTTQTVVATPDAKMHVVVVTAKRLTAAQKAMLD